MLASLISCFSPYEVNILIGHIYCNNHDSNDLIRIPLNELKLYD